jgi:hypothetical protein
MNTVGVDPAVKGAVTMMNIAGEIIGLYFWKSCTRNKVKMFKVNYCNKIAGKFVYDERILPSMGTIGVFLAKEAHRVCGNDYFLACEDAYVGRNKKTSIIVARNAGRICGPLEAHAHNHKPEFVKANVWRKSAIGTKSSTKRHTEGDKLGTKELSLLLVPQKVLDLPEILDKLGHEDDITDSAGVALWGTKQAKKILKQKPSTGSGSSVSGTTSAKKGAKKPARKRSASSKKR